MFFKFLKKSLEAAGFKLVEKNFIKNERLLSVSSFLNLEKFLEHFFNFNKVNFLIQIGANDGKRFDILSKFIKKYTPKAIFLEPLPSNFNDLKKNYHEQKNLIFENLAVSVNDEITKLFKVKSSKLSLYDDHVIGITSFDINHLLKHRIKKSHIIAEKVKSISIEKLFEKHKVNNLDLLYIDIEGYDGNVVIDFLSKSNIRPLIIFEYIHIKNEIFKKTLNLLNEKKYFYFKIEENLVCFPDENKYKIKLA